MAISRELEVLSKSPLLYYLLCADVHIHLQHFTQWGSKIQIQLSHVKSFINQLLWLFSKENLQTKDHKKDLFEIGSEGKANYHSMYVSGNQNNKLC